MFSDSLIFGIISLIVFAAGGYYNHYIWQRQRQMKTILEEPESAEEKKLRIEPPPDLLKRDTRSLQKELKEDLKLAETYVESALLVLSDASFWSTLDIITLEFDERKDSIKREKMHELWNEIMHLQKYLTHATHIIRVIGHREDKTDIPPDAALVEIGTFDWVLDNPLSGYFTHQKLKALRPVLENAQKQIRAWRLRFS